MADMLSLISKMFFIACVGFAVPTVVFFFVFRIPDVIGGLSGRKSRRSIQKQRAANEKSGRSCRSGRENEKSGRSYRSGRENEKSDRLSNEIVPFGDETVSLGEGTIPLKEETVLLNGMEERADAEPAGQPPYGAVAIEVIEEVLIVHSDETVM